MSVSVVASPPLNLGDGLEKQVKLVALPRFEPTTILLKLGMRRFESAIPNLLGQQCGSFLTL